jgi:hypothetical protein
VKATTCFGHEPQPASSSAAMTIAARLT